MERPATSHSVRKSFAELFHSVINGESPAIPTIGIGVGVCLAAVFVNSNHVNISVVSALTSSAAFLFGVLLAFSIQRSRERLSTVQNLLSKGDSALLSIHEMMVIFSEEDRTRIRELIDLHLTDQIDYHLVDHYLGDDSFYELSREVLQVDTSTKNQENAYKVLVDLVVHMMNDRSSIESATAQAMSPIEWLGLMTLLVLLLGLITVVPQGSIVGAVVAGVLAAGLVVLLSLVRRLDRLRWHEVSAIWEPTTRLFRQMGQHPYVPREVITAGRYLPTGLVRVVDYPDPYPIRSTKRVSVVYYAAPGEERPVEEAAAEGRLLAI